MEKYINNINTVQANIAWATAGGRWDGHVATLGLDVYQDVQLSNSSVLLKRGERVFVSVSLNKKGALAPYLKGVVKKALKKTKKGKKFALPVELPVGCLSCSVSKKDNSKLNIRLMWCEPQTEVIEAPTSQNSQVAANTAAIRALASNQEEIIKALGQQSAKIGQILGALQGLAPAPAPAPALASGVLEEDDSRDEVTEEVEEVVEETTEENAAEEAPRANAAATAILSS